ncbi:hypothetical protein RHS01_05829 [Rhizoctonia solani]|uniref:Retrotransposon gag domain-containing protein n=1 Tax=Rhizoctonia solani TaxID=456999 RepID=A0A8H7M4C3_9AGAM|nr:hypothetical protein RHS01_05829 [Rhizoctonia solani]
MGLEASNSRATDPRRHQAPGRGSNATPLPKANPIGLTSQVSFWPEPSKGLPIFAQPTRSKQWPRKSISPSISASPIPHWSTCPSSTGSSPSYPNPVKVDHPDAYTGKIGSEAKQWLTRMLAWTWLNLRMFPTDQEVLSFLLMNMKDSAEPGPTPTLTSLGHTGQSFNGQGIQNRRKITTLTQSGTCADYITKFRTLAMELDWNDAALQGQFARGLHWELQNAALVIDNALREERASHPPKDSWKATPIKDKGKAKETAKIGKDSEYQLGKE